MATPNPDANIWPLAMVVEREFDDGMAQLSMDFYCLDCYDKEQPRHARPVTERSELTNPYFQEECYLCGKAL